MERKTIKTRNLRVYILEDSELWGFRGPENTFRFPRELYGDKISTGTMVFINEPSALAGSYTLVVDEWIVEAMGIQEFIQMISKAWSIKSPTEKALVSLYYADDMGMSRVTSNDANWEPFENIEHAPLIPQDPWILADKAFLDAIDDIDEDYDDDDDDEYDNDEGGMPVFPGYLGPNMNAYYGKMAKTSSPASVYHDLIYGEGEDDDLAEIIKGKKKKKSSKGKKHYSVLASFKHGDHVKKDIARHGIMITEKKFYQRDKEIIKGILKDLIPGDNKWIKEYRKAVLHRWMSCLVITDKEAKARRKAHKKEQRVKSVNRKADVINGVTKSIIRRYNNPFYDPTK